MKWVLTHQNKGMEGFLSSKFCWNKWINGRSYLWSQMVICHKWSQSKRHIYIINKKRGRAKWKKYRVSSRLVEILYCYPLLWMNIYVNLWDAQAFFVWLRFFQQIFQGHISSPCQAQLVKRTPAVARWKPSPAMTGHIVWLLHQMAISLLRYRWSQGTMAWYHWLSMQTTALVLFAASTLNILHQGHLVLTLRAAPMVNAKLIKDKHMAWNSFTYVINFYM